MDGQPSALRLNIFSVTSRTLEKSAANHLATSPSSLLRKRPNHKIRAVVVWPLKQAYGNPSIHTKWGTTPLKLPAIRVWLSCMGLPLCGLFFSFLSFFFYITGPHTINFAGSSPSPTCALFHFLLINMKNVFPILVEQMIHTRSPIYTDSGYLYCLW